MRYQVKTTRVVHRFWKKYEADKDGVIIADSSEIAGIFEAYWFTKLDNEITTNTETPKKKRNSKV